MKAVNVAEDLIDDFSLFKVFLTIDYFNILHKGELTLDLLIEWIFSLFKLVDYLDHFLRRFYSTD
jgi:hypothetical protein